MSKKSKKSRKPAPEPSGGPFSALIRLIGVSVAAILILWVFGVLFAGTDGFRSMVETRIENALGMRLEIGGSRSSLSGRLTFTDIQTTNGVADGIPGVRIGEAEVEPNWWKLARGSVEEGVEFVRVRDWQVNFVTDRAGRMEPHALVSGSHWLAKWGGLALPESADERPGTLFTERRPGEPAGEAGPGAALQQWSHTRFSLQDGIIEWWDARGAVQVSIHEIGVHLTPLVLPTRNASHIHVTAKSAVLPGDQRVRDMDVELLRAEDTYLVLNLQAVRQSTPTGLLSKFKRTKRDPAPPVEEVAPVVAAPLAPEPVAVEVPPAPIPEPSVEERIRNELEDALRSDPR